MSMRYQLKQTRPVESLRIVSAGLSRSHPDSSKSTPCA